MSRCPDAESLFFYTEDLLDPPERMEVASHLASCAACRARVRAESELTVSLRALSLPEPAGSFAEGVCTHIERDRRRRRATYRWWLVAAAFLAASGLRWLLAADFSPKGAGLAIFELLVFIVRSPFALVAWLTDPETWGAAGTVTTSLTGALASSPTITVAVVGAALMVAVAANVVLVGVVRRLARA